MAQNEELAAQEELVSQAFSRQSVDFDHIYTSNAISEWMRQRARNEVMRFIPKGAHMLELNCGTGMDSTWFAKKGIRVVATDNAEGMLSILRRKLAAEALEDTIEVKRCSFNHLDQMADNRFDYIFSNFGGLNCTENLDKVLQQFSLLLRPGGYCTLVIMPRICPWELLMLLKGRVKTAFRRFKKETDAHIEGVHFKCYYYNPGFVKRILAQHFETVSLKGMAFLVPPPFIEGFKEKRPKLFSRLQKAELKLESQFPFNHCCDHFVITLRKKEEE
jgi:ubiquinone/menaquinone biosynthesis C-methylase UbiE